jgi:hypothetical protein
MATRAVLVGGPVGALRLGEQLARTRSSLGAASLGACAGILAVLAVSHLTQTEPANLTRDVVAVVDAHIYVGMLSTLGIMLWSAASSLCLLSGAALLPGREHREASLFLLVAGLLTAALAFDDAFLIHERVAPDHLHVPQMAVFATYAGSIAGFLICFVRRILRTDYLLLGIALGCLGTSMGIDVVLPYSKLGTFIEDCFKFVGIVFWLTYFACAARALLNEDPGALS